MVRTLGFSLAVVVLGEDFVALVRLRLLCTCAWILVSLRALSTLVRVAGSSFHPEGALVGTK